MKKPCYWEKALLLEWTSGSGFLSARRVGSCHRRLSPSAAYCVLPCPAGTAATSPAAAALTGPLSCSWQGARGPSAVAVGLHGTAVQHTRNCTGSSTSQLAGLLQQPLRKQQQQQQGHASEQQQRHHS